MTAYTAWGVMPLYFRAIRAINPWELLCHRIFWSFVLLMGVLAVRRELGATFRWLKDLRATSSLALSGFLICTNWMLFIFCVINGRTLEASFGYFVSPLLTVGIGVVWLRERLNRMQVLALGCAAVGVAVQVVALGHVPVLGMAMAFAFALYGLVRKRSPVGPIPGLSIECLLALPFALFGFWYFWDRGALGFGHLGTRLDILLASSGVITTVPLLLFVAGTQRIRLSLLGFLQYISPSGQFLMAVLVIGEPLNRMKLISFSCVWLGLVLISASAATGRTRK